jgi:hypothetical protein
MGAATKHKRKFLQEHKVCAFCDGKEAATTIEHCPPRAMFQFRQWPEGFEFPACDSCNGGSADDDLLVAMLARMDPFNNRGNLDGAHIGLMRLVNKQFPGLFAKMMPSPVEARAANRGLGISPPPGNTHQQTGSVKVPEEMHAAVSVLARKLAKGIYYQDTGAPFPDDGCLLLNWFSNAELVRAGNYPVFDLLRSIDGQAPVLKRSGKMLNDQFEYKFSIAPDKSIFVLQARFGAAFGLAVFGSAKPQVLEEIVMRLRHDTGHVGPFAVLQSPVL